MDSRVLSSLVLTVGASAALAVACSDSEALKGEAGLQRDDLGSFTTDTGGEVDIPFETPDAVVSAMVNCGPYGYDTLATAMSITDPSGADFYDFESPNSGAMRVSTLADYLPVLIPVSPKRDVDVGGYVMRLVVQADALPTKVTCAATYRLQEASDAASVDVHIVFVGVDSVVDHLNATDGEGLDSLKAVLAGFDDLLGGVGLSVGDVSYEDFGGNVSTYTSVDGEEEFGNLLKTIDSAGTRSITFFFVQDIQFETGVSIVGLAGGPPGAAAVGGTSKSGVVVSVVDYNDSPETISLIMAHESGHFLGLFHTTEKDGSSFDPLDDTDECSESDGQADPADCAGKGYENVMFWQPTAADSADMTGDQGWVVRRSAAVY